MTAKIIILLLSTITIIGILVGLSIALIGRNYKDEEMAGMTES